MPVKSMLPSSGINAISLGVENALIAEHTVERRSTIIYIHHLCMQTQKKKTTTLHFVYHELPSALEV